MQDKILAVMETLHEQGFTLKDLSNFIRNDKEQSIENALEEMLKQSKQNIIDKKIAELLKEFKISEKRAGYKPICTAIKMQYGSNENQTSMKDMYGPLFEVYGTSKKNIFQIMTTAIESGFKVTDPKVKEKYFGSEFQYGKIAPTNRQFVKVIAQQIQMQFPSI